MITVGEYLAWRQPWLFGDLPGGPGLSALDALEAEDAWWRFWHRIMMPQVGRLRRVHGVWKQVVRGVVR